MKKGTRALNQAPAQSGCCLWVSGPSLAWREPSGGLFLERTSDGRGQIPYTGPMWGQAATAQQGLCDPWDPFPCGQTQVRGLI